MNSPRDLKIINIVRYVKLKFMFNETYFDNLKFNFCYISFAFTQASRLFKSTAAIVNMDYIHMDTKITIKVSAGLSCKNLKVSPKFIQIY